MVVPTWRNSSDFISLIVAVLGTTISPYLFLAIVWRRRPGGRGGKAYERPNGSCGTGIRLDTWVWHGPEQFGRAGDHADPRLRRCTSAGKTDVDSSQTAACLRPIVGICPLIFALGIIGTGLMAVPVLAGSAAYAIGESAMAGRSGAPPKARALCDAGCVGDLIGGVVLNFLPVDPVRACWSAVHQRHLVAPVVLVMMNRRNPRVMTQLPLTLGCV